MNSFKIYSLCLFLCMASRIHAQSLTSAQNQAVQHVLTFYKQMGDANSAKKLQDGLRDGSVKFGATQANANATCDITGTKNIIINAGSVDGLNTTSLDAWRATADMAATISHEMVHKEQDSWAWRGSVWKEFAGLGNPCEKQAWGNTFLTMKAWVDQTKTELASMTNRSVREQAEVARRLQMLCNTLTVYRNDYVAVKGDIGDITLTDADGLSMSIDELMTKVATIEKTAKGVIANAAIMVNPFDGQYTGKFSGKGSGRITFKIEGLTLGGRISGSYQGDPCSGAISGRVDADGNISMSLSGSLTSGTDSYPFTGTLSGRLSKGKASGNWFASNQYGKPSGIWSATR